MCTINECSQWLFVFLGNLTMEDSFSVTLSARLLLTKTFHLRKLLKDFLEPLFCRKFFYLNPRFLSAIFIFSMIELFNDILWTKLPFSHYLFLGSVSGICSVVGDLFESFIKRCAGVKVRINFDSRTRAHFFLDMAGFLIGWIRCCWSCQWYIGTSWWYMRRWKKLAY